MDEQTQQALQEQLNKVPEAVSSYIFSDEYDNTFGSIAEKHSIPEEYRTPVKNEITLTLIDLADSNNLADNIAKAFDKDETDSESAGVAKDALTEIVTPVKERASKEGSEGAKKTDDEKAPQSPQQSDEQETDTDGQKEGAEKQGQRSGDGDEQSSPDKTASKEENGESPKDDDPASAKGAASAEPEPQKRDREAARKALSGDASEANEAKTDGKTANSEADDTKEDAGTVKQPATNGQSADEKNGPEENPGEQKESPQNETEQTADSTDSKQEKEGDAASDSSPSLKELTKDGAMSDEGVVLEKGDGGPSSSQQNAPESDDDEAATSDDTNKAQQATEGDSGENLDRDQILKEVEGAGDGESPVAQTPGNKKGNDSSPQSSNDPHKKYGGDDPYREPIE